ncbi:MAG TPA: 50S ribosomal protein L21e [Thermoplasmata archaeon]|nr:50S ribosomal protein L21e [Thermoplasmata archaeon]
MVKSSKGFKSRTRGTLTKSVRAKGLPPITRFLTPFAIGDKVIVRLEASDPHGMPHPRYQGRVCTVVAKSGRSYRIEFLDGGKRKELVAHPIHLVAANSSPRRKA